MNKLNIMLIGCGRWGSFIGWYLDQLHHSVTIYGLENAPSFITLKENRKNDYITLTDTIKLTSDIKEALSKDVIIISINSQNLRSVCHELKEIGLENKKIVLCMKGLEIETGKRLSEVVEEIVEQNNKVAVWIGPGHVQSFYQGIPNCMVIDSEDSDTIVKLVDEFSSSLIRFYYGQDLIGNEIGAASKNVIGIAAGMLDGYRLSSLKGAKAVTVKGDAVYDQYEHEITIKINALKLKEIKIENLAFIVFIVASLLDIVANEDIKKFYKNNLK